jgi:hypothetical protein
MTINVYWSPRKSAHFSTPILIILKFSQQIFEKYSNIKFHENRPVGEELVHADVRTDGHDEVNGRLSQFCECV